MNGRKSTRTRLATLHRPSRRSKRQFCIFNGIATGHVAVRISAVKRRILWLKKKGKNTALKVAQFRLNGQRNCVGGTKIRSDARPPKEGKGESDVPIDNRKFKAKACGFLGLAGQFHRWCTMPRFQACHLWRSINPPDGGLCTKVADYGR